jgi:nucleoside-diphosphate-sugar epimerase
MRHGLLPKRSMPVKTYLVTGGTGFVGSALVRRLVEEGHQVRVLDDNSRGAARKLGSAASAVELVIGDIRNSQTVRQAVRGVDCVCHLAYINGTEYFYSKPDMVLDVAVKGMINILDACLEHGVREFVLASSSEVYQTPSVIPTPECVPLCVPDVLNPRYSYGGGKIISELMVVNYGRKFFNRAMIFRPHNAYGPDMGGEHVIPQFITRMATLFEKHTDIGEVIKFPIQGSGRETRSFVYITDLIAGIIRILNSGEHLGIYHIGTEDEICIADLASRIANYFGREISILSGDLRTGGTLRRCPGIGRMRALGYQPRVTLDEGLAITVDWYRRNLFRTDIGFVESVSQTQR